MVVDTLRVVRPQTLAPDWLLLPSLSNTCLICLFIFISIHSHTIFSSLNKKKKEKHQWGVEEGALVTHSFKDNGAQYRTALKDLTGKTQGQENKSLVSHTDTCLRTQSPV